MKTQFTSAVAGALVVMVSVGMVGVARAAPYVFDVLAETPRPPPVGPISVYRLPALNDHGTVALMQPAPTTGTIYTGTLGALRAVETPGLYVHGGVSINNHGRIGFVAIPFGGQTNSLYAVDPGQTLIRVGNAGMGEIDNDAIGYIETAISDGGAVMSVTDGPMLTPSSVVIGDGSSPAREAFRTHNPAPPGPSSYSTQLRYPRMSAGGDWAAWERGGSSINYTAIHTNYGSIYSDGPVVPPGERWPIIGNVDIADGGVAVFVGKFRDGPLQLFTTRAGGAPTPVPGSAGLGDGFVAVNDAGDIALLNGGEEDRGTRLVLLRGGVPETVLSAGDPLLGSTVSTIGFDPKGFNNSDQFALLVGLADGRDVYVLASPVPEPGGIAALVVGAGVLVRRRRWGVGGCAGRRYAAA